MINYCPLLNSPHLQVVLRLDPVADHREPDRPEPRVVQVVLLNRERLVAPVVMPDDRGLPPTAEGCGGSIPTTPQELKCNNFNH